MKANLLPIGRMARINHVTVATLRLYDRMGLLKPAFIDPISGYRYYDIQQNARLDMIAYMKELGMSLAEIQDVLDKEDITLIEEILSEKNEQIYRQYRELKDRHASVARAIASIERYRKSPDTGTTSLEYIDQRYVWGIPCGENFYETGIAGYEKVLAELRMSLIDRNFSQIHSYNVGTSVKQADFLRLNFRPDRVFIFADASLRKRQQDVATLDSGMYACIYADAYDQEVPYAKQLLAHCRERRYSICGDYICEVLTEFNVFNERSRNMFLRLQVPIFFRREKRPAGLARPERPRRPEAEGVPVSPSPRRRRRVFFRKEA